MRHLRAFQLTHGHPGAQGGKPGGGLLPGHETVYSPQRQFQKAGEHDFTEQGGINLIVMVLQMILRRQVFFNMSWTLNEIQRLMIAWSFEGTRRHLFASQPHQTVVGPAFGAAALTLALPFLPTIGQWCEFVPPPAIYFVFLLAVVLAFLVATGLVKRAFYARMARMPDR